MAGRVKYWSGAIALLEQNAIKAGKVVDPIELQALKLHAEAIYEPIQKELDDCEARRREIKENYEDIKETRKREQNTALQSYRRQLAAAKKEVERKEWLEQNDRLNARARMTL